MEIINDILLVFLVALELMLGLFFPVVVAFFAYALMSFVSESK